MAPSRRLDPRVGREPGGTANDAARRLFAPLGATYERAGALLSLGLERGWRRRLVDALAPRDGARYLDVATGTGLVAREIRRRAAARVVGVDLSPSMLAAGSRRDVAVARAEELPFASETFDGLTFTYLLRYVDDPGATLAELARVVRPGGRVASLEFHVPSSPPLRAGWSLYTALVLPALAALVSRDWVGVARFLPASIRGFYERHSLADVERLWSSAGMREVRSEVLGLGAAVVTSGTVVADASRRAPRPIAWTPDSSRARSALAPAFYALPGGAWWRQAWTLLHPPYTAWHLSYVLLGAALAPMVHPERVVGTLLAFFFALGIGVHALDELNGRPLRTGIPSGVLVGLGVSGIGLGVALGIVAAAAVDPSILAFVAVGIALALAYPLELTRGRLHGDLWFALGWGAFPVLTAYWANALSFGPAALVAAAYAVALSYAQRRLSMWVRLVRRRTERVEGAMVVEGGRRALDAPTLIAASDSALRWLSLASVLIALAVLLVRLYH
jgi:demethylmenaquinone methyltransferase/2-methoxy-6-polyprenyl-1,4-benzoquinol methylase